MEQSLGDVLHCDEQLRTTLYSDDKEKLRKRLALLQREYHRTVQKLQRAEHLEAVRKHVRSRVTHQNHQDQRGSEVSSDPRPDPVDGLTGTATMSSPYQGHNGDLVDSENTRSSQVIRFLLPSDDACTLITDPTLDPARDQRPGPSLRLRSRRSRLRWERRKKNSEAARSIDTSEEGQEPSERMESATRDEGEERAKTEEIKVVNESEELLSGSESESPSLLLTHWNIHGHTGARERDGTEKAGGQDQWEKETDLRDEGNKKSVVHTEGGQQGGTENGREKDRERQEDESSTQQIHGGLCGENNDKETEQNLKTESKKCHENSVEIKEEAIETTVTEHDGKSEGILGSCTLVEGLIFPAEYYVRTTRRMTFSQSQPDMQAVILSQLSGRPYRTSQGRGRGCRRRTHPISHSVQNSQTAASSGPQPPSSHTQAADTSAERSSNSQSSISASQTNTDACLSPAVSTAHPARGRKRKRGRGRGKNMTPRCSVSFDNHRPGFGEASDVPQPTSTMASPSQSLPGSAAPKPCLVSEELTPVLEAAQPTSTHTTDAQVSSGVPGPESSPASGLLEKVFPIFLKTSCRTKGAAPMNRTSWQSLLLPSPPSSQTSLLPNPLVNNLVNFDVQQDFHLPDDQFASLKLHKLRQVAVASGVEHFTSPSYNTRSSTRRAYTRDIGISDPAMPLPLPLSLTPTIVNSPQSPGEKLAATPRVDLHTSTPPHQTCTSSAESASVVQASATDCVDISGDQGTGDLHALSQSSFTANDIHRPGEHTFQPQLNINCPEPHAEQCAGKVNEYSVGHSMELQIKRPSVISPEKQTDCPAVIHPLEEQTPTNHQTEVKVAIVTSVETPEKPSKCYANNCTAVQTCNDTDDLEECPVIHLDTKDPPKNYDKSSTHHSVHSQLLLSPILSWAPCPFLTPHLLPPALPPSPPLPSLGLTPHPAVAALPLTSSPRAPSLCLPPPHSPSTQAMSPPVLSPCVTFTSLPPSFAPVSPSNQTQASCEPAAACSTASSIQPQGASVRRENGNGEVPRAEEMAEEDIMRCTHTLKAPAGGCLVDACCLPRPSGGLCVAAAGKWAVCVWNQTSTSDWSLAHTWTFNEPVINVFPVPDAAGLMCVTLGQLEIREVRMLSCSSFLQMLLCVGVIQAVVGVAKSRVVTSSHSATGSTLEMFTPSEDNSAPSCQSLVSPGVCVAALAAVDGLPDALIGTDDAGCLFVWNLRTGQLLQRIALGGALSHTACLRGHSSSGVLFVLLQHQFLSSLEEGEKESKGKDQMFPLDKDEDERKRNALFSLVATNPLSGKSVLAARLYAPEAWSGRLCEADVNSSRVVGLSQSGCVCVWDLGCQGGARMVQAPESDGWQLARWGGRDTLVTGHHNGDVTLHCYTVSPLCHQQYSLLSNVNPAAGV